MTDSTDWTDSTDRVRCVLVFSDETESTALSVFKPKPAATAGSDSARLKPTQAIVISGSGSGLSPTRVEDVDAPASPLARRFASEHKNNSPPTNQTLTRTPTGQHQLTTASAGGGSGFTFRSKSETESPPHGTTTSAASGYTPSPPAKTAGGVISVAAAGSTAGSTAGSGVSAASKLGSFDPFSRPSPFAKKSLFERNYNTESSDAAFLLALSRSRSTANPSPNPNPIASQADVPKLNLSAATNATATTSSTATAGAGGSYSARMRASGAAPTFTRDRDGPATWR